MHLSSSEAALVAEIIGHLRANDHCSVTVSRNENSVTVEKSVRTRTKVNFIGSSARGTEPITPLSVGVKIYEIENGYIVETGQ